MNADEAQCDFYKSKRVITTKIEKLSKFAQEEGKNGSEEYRRFRNQINVRGLQFKFLSVPRKMYSNGRATRKYFSNFLQCNAENQGTDWSCNASVVLKVLAQKEGKEDLCCKEIEYTFNAKENDYRFAQSKFMTLKALMDPENGWYDTATDSITLSVEINAEIPVRIEIPSQMPENMGNLFNKGDKYSDCTLVSSDGIKFKVYKGILACQSPVFEAMFEHGMIEAQNGIVQIEDIHSEILGQMLHYMYCGTKPNLEENENIVGELLVAADKYGLIQLKMFCENKLLTSLNSENVCELLALADLHSAKLLKANALKFIKENPNQMVTQTEGWKMLKEENCGEKLFSEIMEAINYYSWQLHYEIMKAINDVKEN